MLMDTDEDVVGPFCAAHERARALVTTQSIGMSEHPTDAVRAKRDSSIVRGCRTDPEQRGGHAGEGDEPDMLAAQLGEFQSQCGHGVYASLPVRRRTKVVQTFPSTGSVLRLLGGIVDEVNADWASENLFMSKESLRPVLGLERAENRIEGFAPSEEVRKRAEVIMMVALDEYAKAS